MIYRPFEGIGGYILKQYVSVRAVLEIIVGEAAAPVYFFGRASSTFLHTSGKTMLKCIRK